MTIHTEFTLWLDDKLVARAHAFAQANGKSVSQIVADYFALLTVNETHEAVQLSPTVQALKGALRGVDIGVEEYQKYLDDKYL